MPEDLTVAEAIKQLREQLTEAQREGSGKGLRFGVKTVEVELTIVLKSVVEGGVGVKAWFVEASGKTKGANETTHKVKLVLEPVGPDGKPTQVRDTEHERE